MAKTLRRELPYVARSTLFHIIPLGDMHIGAAGCDESLLKETVKYIKDTKNCYWIGMGDYAEFINRSDPRFDPNTLASWIKVSALADLASAQMERFLAIVEPIAGRCLCMLTGNHEDSIRRHYERDIFLEICAGIKKMAGHPADYQLQIGYYGWLRLNFKREVTGGVVGTNVDVNLHHGFGGGKLKGGKALQMERWLYTHEADLVIFGHTHNADAYRAAVERLDADGNIQIETRRGVYSGTYLRTNGDGHSTYSEIKGYLPLPVGGVEIVLRPGAERRADMVKVIT